MLKFLKTPAGRWIWTYWIWKIQRRRATRKELKLFRKGLIGRATPQELLAASEELKQDKIAQANRDKNLRPYSEF